MVLTHWSDFESYTDDAEDPVKFTEAFFQVIDRKVHKYKPLINYDYVRKFMRDESDFISVLKGRQVGISFASIMKALHKAIVYPKTEKIYVSVREENAAWLIGKGLELIDHLQDDFTVKLKRRQVGYFEIAATGSVIKAIPAISAGSRGFSSDVTLDELAFMPNERQIMDSILQTTVREGYNVEFLSTPFGQSGAFFDIWNEGGWEVDRTWQTPTEQSMFERTVKEFTANASTDYSYHIIPWWACPDLDYKRARKRCKTHEIWLQEYCLGFVDEAKALMPYSLLKGQVDMAMGLMNWKKAPITQNQRIMGVDFAEGYNETAIVVAENIGRIWRTIYYWHGRGDKDSYLPHIRNVFIGLRVNQVFTDATGKGKPITADLTKMLSGHTVGINLTNSLKEDMVYNLVSLLEGKELILPDYREMIEQLHRIRGTKTRTGKLSFSGKKGVLEDDLVWALALATMPSMDEAEYAPVESASFNWSGNFFDPDVKEEKAWYQGDDDDGYSEFVQSY